MIAVPNPLASRAILVGAGHYQVMGDLPVARRNSAALADELRDEKVWGLSASHCILVEDPVSSAEILDSVTEACRDATDTILFYFAGHAIEDPEGSGIYLALAGARSSSINDAVSFNLVRERLLDSRAPNRIILLDCCYSNRLAGRIGGAGAALAEGASAEGLYVMAAAAETTVAFSPAGEPHSVFTRKLLEIIRHGIPGGDPVLDLEAVYWRLNVVTRGYGPSPQRNAGKAVRPVFLVRNQAPASAATTGGGLSWRPVIYWVGRRGLAVTAVVATAVMIFFVPMPPSGITFGSTLGHSSDPPVSHPSPANPARVYLSTLFYFDTDLSYRPTDFEIDQDGSYSLIRMKWSTWSATEAHGAGYVLLMACGSPVRICQGRYYRVPVAVRLVRPVKACWDQTARRLAPPHYFWSEIHVDYFGQPDALPLQINDLANFSWRIIRAPQVCP